MKKTIICALAAVMLVLGGCGLCNVNAETQTQTMRVSPPNQRVILVPGESYSDVIRISNANDSTRALEYKVAVGSFSETGEEGDNDDYGVVDTISASSYNQIMDWISFDKESGTVQPNGTDFVTYTIDVPENAPAGGQYATILVRDETGKNGENHGNVSIENTYQFASIIYAEVAGETKEIGAVLENSVPVLSFSTPFTVSSTVENSGNVHTDAKYTLEIFPLFSDEEVYSNAGEPKTSLILPETKRYNTQTWEEAPTVGIFRVKQTVEIFGETSIVEKTVIFCPLWLLFLILFVIVAAVIWLVMRAKNRKKQAAEA